MFVLNQPARRVALGLCVLLATGARADRDDRDDDDDGPRTEHRDDRANDEDDNDDDDRVRRRGNGRFELNRDPGLHHAFDFSDGFYRRNGIDPRKLVARKEPDGVLAVRDTTTDPTRNDVRILAVNGGFDAAGALLYYPDPPAMFFADAFMDNGSGDEARVLADLFRAFIFPKRDGNPLVPAPPNRRQDNLFETTMGYLTHNPLGLWRLTFVHYTDAAFDTVEGQEALAELESRNGTDLDGTPVLRRIHEILDLEAQGFVDLAERPDDGSAGPPWVV